MTDNAAGECRVLLIDVIDKLSERDLGPRTFSGWRARRKMHPRFDVQNGMPFPDGLSIPFAVEAGCGQSAPMFPNEYGVSREG